jgi:two-component system nitrate/nitrite sensor histidine kinase NarX
VESIVPALRAGVDESYQDVRELLHNFRTRLQEGICSVRWKPWWTNSAARAASRSISWPRRRAAFPSEQQLQLLFIVQEALSNVRKHAAASRVWVAG